MTVQLNSSVLRLALCALVCMFALQTWEVSHDHAHTGASFECQVCNSPADLALPAPGTVAPGAMPLQQLGEQARQSGLAVFFVSFHSRAPPAIS